MESKDRTFKEFIKIIRDIFFESSLDLTELIGVINCFFCAFWMFFHPTLFAQGSVYRSIGLLGDENVWGSLFFALGSAKLFCIYIDKYRARKWVALFSFFLWLFLLITFFLDNPNALILVFIFQFLLIGIIEYLRHREHAIIRLESRKRLGLE